MEPDVLVRTWIADILQARSKLLAIAIRQRAKFEGWLKFELAAYAELHGAEQVKIEAATDDSVRSRADLTFHYNGERYDIELKTCNTNYRMKGVLDRTRPITKNVAGIITDAKKLASCAEHGVIAACMFPVQGNDQRWAEYLVRIGNETGVLLSAHQHTTRVSVPIGSNDATGVIVISFVAAKARLRALRTAAD